MTNRPLHTYYGFVLYTHSPCEPFPRVWGSNHPRISEGPRPFRGRPDLAKIIRKITGWACENKTGKHRGVPRLTMSQGADRRPVAHVGSSGHEYGCGWGMSQKDVLKQAHAAPCGESSGCDETGRDETGRGKGEPKNQKLEVLVRGGPELDAISKPTGPGPGPSIASSGGGSPPKKYES